MEKERTEIRRVGVMFVSAPPCSKGNLRTDESLHARNQDQNLGKKRNHSYAHIRPNENAHIQVLPLMHCAHAQCRNIQLDKQITHPFHPFPDSPVKASSSNGLPHNGFHANRNRMDTCAHTTIQIIYSDSIAKQLFLPLNEMMNPCQNSC